MNGLERLGNSDGPIDELRITSRGGEAWATLPRRRACWILVTPEMAARCLKGTKIDSFAAPEAQDAFEVRLGFFRALK